MRNNTMESVMVRNSIRVKAAVLLAFGLPLALAAAASAGAAAPEARSSRHLERLGDEISAAFEAAAATVNPSVVPIFSESTVTVKNPLTGAEGDELRQFFGDQLFNRFFGPTLGPAHKTVHALGSGVIASPDGYILTNNHVVEGAQELTVVLPDGTRKRAKVVGTDPETDLALVKVDATDLPAATFGDSHDVKIGQWVIAVGNPFELLHTTTAGIVSAKGRSSVGIGAYEDFIQTDASINPGNSGGALADLHGRVIGINSEITTPSGGSVGLGFAIPIDLAKNVMEQLKAHGRVIRGYLGVTLQSLSPGLAKGLGMAPGVHGVLIADVEPGSPASRADLHRGDLITRFDGEPVRQLVQLRDLVAGRAPGTVVRLGILRDGTMLSVPVTLGEQPQQHQTSESMHHSAAPNPERLGLVVETLSSESAQQLGYQGEGGALVVQVRPGSPADNAGLQRDDLIKEVNRQPIHSAVELGDKLRNLKSGAPVALLVQRGSTTFFVAIRMP